MGLTLSFFLGVCFGAPLGAYGFYRYALAWTERQQAQEIIRRQAEAIEGLKTVVDSHSDKASIATDVNPDAVIQDNQGRIIDAPEPPPEVERLYAPGPQAMEKLEQDLNELSTWLQKLRPAQVFQLAAQKHIDIPPDRNTQQQMCEFIAEHYRKRIQERPTSINVNSWRKLLK